MHSFSVGCKGVLKIAVEIIAERSFPNVQCMSLLALVALILLSLIDTCECAQSVLLLSATPKPRAVGPRSFIFPPRLRDSSVSSFSGRELWVDNLHHAYAHKQLFFQLMPAHLR